MDGITFAENKFPTAFDYADASDLGGSTAIDEIKGTSRLVFDAAVGTTSGYNFEFDRVVEKKNTARTADFDEGWVAGTDTRHERKSAGTMRVTDARVFDDLVRRGTADSGVARTAAALSAMGQSIIKKKAHCILYGGLPAADGSVDYKEIPGYASYLDRISDVDKMRAIWEKGEASPFVSDNCLALDNQDGADVTDSDTVDGKKSSNVWTSVYGIAYGTDGVITTFPSFQPSAGYSIICHGQSRDKYTDKRDGIEKIKFSELFTAEAMFGIAVKNRFCLSGLRNIYLGHKAKADKFDEMYRVEQNLITLYNMFNMGETGLSMTFYCSQFLLDQMAAYQKNHTVIYQVAGNDSNNASYGSLPNGSLKIAEGITLVSDFAIKTSEGFISEKETY